MAEYHNEEQPQQNQKWSPSKDRDLDIQNPRRLRKVNQIIGGNSREKIDWFEERRGGT
jgi:hypothetical protein